MLWETCSLLCRTPEISEYLKILWLTSGSQRPTFVIASAVFKYSGTWGSLQWFSRPHRRLAFVQISTETPLDSSSSTIQTIALLLAAALPFKRTWTEYNLWSNLFEWKLHCETQWNSHFFKNKSMFLSCSEIALGHTGVSVWRSLLSQAWMYGYRCMSCTTSLWRMGGPYVPSNTLLFC